MVTTNELVAFYENKLRVLSKNEDELTKLSKLVDRGKKQIAEDHIVLQEKDKVIKQLTDKVAEVTKMLEETKQTAAAQLAALKTEVDTERNRTAKQVTDLQSAQELVAKELAELKTTYRALETQHDSEMKRLRLSRTSQVAQVRRETQAEAAAKLEKVRRHVEDRDKADPIMQCYGQAKGTLNCVRLIVAEGGVVPAEIMKRLEADVEKYKEQFDKLDITDLTPEDFKFRSDFNEHGTNLPRPPARSSGSAEVEPGTPRV